MKNKVEVRHSQSNSAWKIVGTMPGGRYELARVDYGTGCSVEHDSRERSKANERATRIAQMFNSEGE
jgi:hypothetical protein